MNSLSYDYVDQLSLFLSEGDWLIEFYHQLKADKRNHSRFSLLNETFLTNDDDFFSGNKWNSTANDLTSFPHKLNLFQLYVKILTKFIDYTLTDDNKKISNIKL